MKTRIVEATNGFNWGKFLLGQFDTEYEFRSAVLEGSNPVRRWRPTDVLVFDLATGEGAIFFPGGSVEYDLNMKHQIWVCPMYEPFLRWLYDQPLPIDLDSLPASVNVDPEGKLSALYGRRRTRAGRRV